MSPLKSPIGKLAAVLFCVLAGSLPAQESAPQEAREVVQLNDGAVWEGNLEFSFGTGTGAGSTPCYDSSNVNLVNADTDYFGGGVYLAGKEDSFITYAFESAVPVQSVSLNFDILKAGNATGTFPDGHLLVQFSTNNTDWEEVKAIAPDFEVSSLPPTTFALPGPSKMVYIRLYRVPREKWDFFEVREGIYKSGSAPGLPLADVTPWVFTAALGETGNKLSQPDK